jgi:hypothetical protein
MGVIVVIPIVVAVFFLVTVVFQLLWNITMPEVFGLKPVRFWQAFRMLLIAGFLFGWGILGK